VDVAHRARPSRRGATPQRFTIGFVYCIKYAIDCISDFFSWIFPSCKERTNDFDKSVVSANSLSKIDNAAMVSRFVSWAFLRLAMWQEGKQIWA
jgi:hypothetical protein